MAYKGKFKPKNPEKYKGDTNNIVFRSSWERIFMNYLDKNPAVLEWQSEEFCIPYVSPLDNKMHRYFPDFRMKIKNTDGIVETVVVEIKPKKEDAMNSLPPQRGKKLMRYHLREVAVWGVNDAKFQAASVYCEERGWKFQVLNEDHLGLFDDVKVLPHKK